MSLTLSEIEEQKQRLYEQEYAKIQDGAARHIPRVAAKALAKFMAHGEPIPEFLPQVDDNVKTRNSERWVWHAINNRLLETYTSYNEVGGYGPDAIGHGVAIQQQLERYPELVANPQAWQDGQGLLFR